MTTSERSTKIAALDTQIAKLKTQIAMLQKQQDSIRKQPVTESTNDIIEVPKTRGALISILKNNKAVEIKLKSGKSVKADMNTAYDRIKYHSLNRAAGMNADKTLSTFKLSDIVSITPLFNGINEEINDTITEFMVDDVDIDDNKVTIVYGVPNDDNGIVVEVDRDKYIQFLDTIYGIDEDSLRNFDSDDRKWYSIESHEYISQELDNNSFYNNRSGAEYSDAAAYLIKNVPELKGAKYNKNLK